MNLYPTCEECQQTKFCNDFREGPDSDRRLCKSCAAKAWGDSFECRECGEHDRAAFWIDWAGAELESAKLCHDCHFWHQKLEWKAVNDSNQVIVEGRHYHIAPDSQTPGWGCGHGGAPFLIRFHDGREVVSRNLWHQGEIPDRFRERLPDNATFGHWNEARVRAGLPSLEVLP